MSNELVTALKSRPWAMEPRALKVLAEQMAMIDGSGILSTIAIARQPKELRIDNGRAVINISGVLLKSVPGWLRLWGLNATGYDEIREQVSAALASKAVTGIHLVIDSPGGIIDDLEKTADLIYQARQEKPLTATINSLGASAAYWLASQAETIDTDELNTEIGSIGVYTVYADWTKLEEKIGIKVIVIRSGEHKGMGIDGVTENQIAAVQENIDSIAGNFINAVARGRGADTEKISELATGQLWIAAKARELGLIDIVTVQTNQTSQSDIKGETVMKTEEEIKAEQVDIDMLVETNTKLERGRMLALGNEFKDDPEFAMDQFVKGQSVDEAKAEYCDVLREKLKTQAAKAPAATERVEGTDPIVTGDTDDAGSGDFLAEARELAETKNIPVTAAMKKLARMKPALHQAFLSKCETQGKSMYAESA